jgi:dipeptidyl aminopeptidase/acylaminoacyl peptidase
MTSWTGRAAALSASDDATAVAVLASTSYALRDVSAGSPDGLIRVSDTRPELRGITWGTQERLSWRAPDGLEIDGVLVLPPGKGRADGPFPLVTMIHGGPYDRWADELMAGWWRCGQWLAAAGYAVFHPNPRGSKGHGQAFAALVARAVGQGEWTDILAGLDELVADGVADPARLGIAGWSHGGFMAAWAITQTGRFRAAVMGAGSRLGHAGRRRRAGPDRSRPGRQLRLGRPRPTPPRPAQPDLPRGKRHDPGTDPAR